MPASKRYYDKFHSGEYYILAYRYGDKRDSYEPGWNKCQGDKSSCFLVLSIIPEHPRAAEILAIVEEKCNESHNSKLDGANDCTHAGIFYSKKGDYKKAYKIWASNSKFHASDSFMIMGSNKTSKKQKSSAFKDYCLNKVELKSKSDSEIQQRNCAHLASRYTHIPSELNLIAGDWFKYLGSACKCRN